MHVLCFDIESLRKQNDNKEMRTFHRVLNLVDCALKKMKHR